MTTPDIDAESARIRLRNQMENAARLREAITRSVESKPEETEAAAEESEEFDQEN